MTNESYNGWSNYETWNVNLWLANDEPMYRHVTTMASGDPDDWAADERAAFLAPRIEEYVRDLFGTFGTFGDLDNAEELDAVDWEEVAAAWLED